MLAGDVQTLKNNNKSYSGSFFLGKTPRKRKKLG